MRVDELNFRTSRKHEAIAKYGGTQCLVGVCSGSDDQAHVESCFGYKLQLHADTLFDNINIANSLCQDLLVLSITSSIHQSFLLKEYKISSSNGRVSGVSENLGIILRK